MVKITPLTGTEIKIIGFFLQHMIESFAIREIARKTNLDYKQAHSAVQKLVKNKVLLKERHANLDLCSLNFKNDLTTIYYVEMLRKDEFLQKQKELGIFFTDIKKKIKELSYLLLVFGSFAKGRETKHSDLDLLIVAPNKNIGEEIERVINGQALFLKRKIQCLILDEKDFLDNLSSKKLNVVVEAFKNHLILNGVEIFYNGVRQVYD